MTLQDGLIRTQSFSELMEIYSSRDGGKWQRYELHGILIDIDSLIFGILCFQLMQMMKFEMFYELSLGNLLDVGRKVNNLIRCPMQGLRLYWFFNQGKVVVETKNEHSIPNFEWKSFHLHFEMK